MKRTMGLEVTAFWIRDRVSWVRVRVWLRWEEERRRVT